MKSTGLRILILALVIFSITVVFFIGFKLNVAPHVQSEMDRWVGIATVCTAISSAIVGLISVWVMFDQKKVQDKLMDMQIHEHQPVFKVKIEQHAGLDESGKTYDYEEVKISNIGNSSYILKEWKIEAYAYFQYDLKEFSEEYFIHLYDYFGTKTDETNVEDFILTTRNSDKVKNIDKINKMNAYVNSLPGSRDCPYFYIQRKIYTYIKYIDLYGNEQERYFINTLPVENNTEFLKLHNKVAHQAQKCVSEFDVFKCVKEIEAKQHSRSRL